jgi:hypothetical protein
VFDTLQALIVFALSAATLVFAIWGFIDCMRRPGGAFTSASKQSKALWAVLLGLAAVLAFVMLPWPLGGGGGVLNILGIVAIGIVLFYFVNVKPAVGGGTGLGGGGSSGRSGGW